MADILIGIDVGGTFTDAVAVRDGEVLATAKVPTQPNALERSLLGALDQVMRGIAPGDVTRVSFSTTLITNLLAQGLLPDVALLLIPGPGCDPAMYHLPGRAWIVGGAVDFRGREIDAIDLEEVDAALEATYDTGFRRLAVVGKFSSRNPLHERQIVARALRLHSDWHVVAGHTVSGQLNFPRRAAATAFTLAVEEPYRAFFTHLCEALSARGLTCPIVILKGDGGTLPLAAAERLPLQSIFSGPAASVLGALALRPKGATSVVVDVGGTTTDLALILDGEPLLASRGAVLDGMALPVRAFATRSLPVGGDDVAVLGDGKVLLRPVRLGMAACLGGSEPTLTDALRYLGETQVGDAEAARLALEKLGPPAEVANVLVEQALSRIESGIEAMFEAWQKEPVYRLWELRQKGERRPDVLVGVGAGASSLVPRLAQRLGARVLIPSYAPVANALGAAVARPTYTTTVHIDTERRTLAVAETGVVEPLAAGRLTLDGACVLARDRMARRGAELGLESMAEDVVEVLAEQFNVVEGWGTVGQIFDIHLERRCGLVKEWKLET
ncbi:MAG: hydantoinase/oxoprolinase family protein [Anaerolineae bacterium]|jgi:N-methylhydantoinase A/oxoprolinase/acetone carboxylase beta subunit|nr:hydantoinase/oxoprolinase family protein [Anaerolineae bacterium]